MSRVVAVSMRAIRATTEQSRIHLASGRRKETTSLEENKAPRCPFMPLTLSALTAGLRVILLRGWLHSIPPVFNRPGFFPRSALKITSHRLVFQCPILSRVCEGSESVIRQNSSAARGADRELHPPGSGMGLEVGFHSTLDYY